MAKASRPPELFVLGSGRSGTTIVLSAIAQLDGVTAVPRLAGRIPVLTGLSAQLIRRGWGPRAWIRPSSESTALFEEAGLTPEFQVAVRRSVGPEDGSSLNMERLRSRLDSIRTGSKATTVVVKNTTVCARVPILAATFPQAAFVHVLRHPSSVVMSLLRTDFWHGMTLWWDGRTTEQYGRDMALSSEEVAAQHWSRQVETAVTDLSQSVASRSMLIRYEDFVDRPIDVLTKLEEVGLAVENPENYGQRLRSLGIRPTHTRAPIPPVVTAAVEKHCASVAESIGLSLS